MEDPGHRMSEPRYAADYTARQIEAARRVLVDVQQVLAGFRDSIVLVGGWVPDLLLPDAAEPHVGSIDVDLALDAKRLEDEISLNNALLENGQAVRKDAWEFGDWDSYSAKASNSAR